MNRLHWEMSRLRKFIGWHGVIGSCLFATSLIFLFFAVFPAKTELQVLKTESSTLSLGILEEQKSGRPAPQNRPEQLGTFYRFFPESSSAPNWLVKIHAVATEHALVLERGDYSMTRDRDGKLMRYEVTLPLKGTYTQIREFLHGILARIPIAAVESVSFKRDTISAATVDAQVRLILYLREAS